MLNSIASFFIFGSISAVLKTLGPEKIARLMVLFGKAFGPDGIRHFSELSPAEQAELLARVPVLKTTHKDWPSKIDWVPRTLTTFVGQPGPILAGNTTDPHPIPERGHWFVQRGYFAITFTDGYHFSIGFRWDDVDGYFNFPRISFKRV